MHDDFDSLDVDRPIRRDRQRQPLSGCGMTLSVAFGILLALVLFVGGIVLFIWYANSR